MKILLLLVALSSLDREPSWLRQPRTPVTLTSAGFELRTELPHGWSFTADHGFVTPPELASSCRVRVEFRTNDWDRFLVAALRATEGALTDKDARYVLKVAEHPAVSNRYRREELTVRDVSIDLSDLRPDSGVVWTFEGSPTAEGSDCEHQFLSIVHRATISRVTPPADTP